MKKILVVQLRRLGELILTTPALAALRKNYPEAEITLAVDAACRELLPAIGTINESFTFSGKGGNRDSWTKLLFASYDVCLDFTGSDRSAICAILSKANRRVSFESGVKTKVRHIFYNQFVSSSPRENHAADHFLNLLKAVDISGGDARPALELPEWSIKKAGQILEEIGLTAPFLIIHPGTTRPDKYWLPERWAEVIDFCKNDLRLACVVTGSSNAYERSHIESIRARAEFLDLSGRTDLLTLAALIRRSSLLLSVDSVAMQLGAAFGIPQVALFGKTNPFLWRPRHDKALALQAGEDSVTPQFTSHHRPVPMSELSTRQVIDAIRKLIHPL